MKIILSYLCLESPISSKFFLFPDVQQHSHNDGFFPCLSIQEKKDKRCIPQLNFKQCTAMWSKQKRTLQYSDYERNSSGNSYLNLKMIQNLYAWTETSWGLDFTWKGKTSLFNSVVSSSEPSYEGVVSKELQTSVWTESQKLYIYWVKHKATANTVKYLVC